ncbi:unnamed protein product, partial [Ceratitis capitata]
KNNSLPADSFRPPMGVSTLTSTQAKRPSHKCRSIINTLRWVTRINNSNATRKRYQPLELQCVHTKCVFVKLSHILANSKERAGEYPVVREIRVGSEFACYF